MRMKRLLLLPMLWLLLGQAWAGIVLDEPVIEMNGDEPQYLKFVGTNADNNYRFTLDTYQDDGLKFRLTIDRIDASQPAAFTAADLSDGNYWEPMFRKYTQELAGEVMEASENIKQLIVNGVALLDNQFAGYCDCLKYVEIVANGDYTIPDGCFAQGSAGNYSTKEIYCDVSGTLTLGSNVVETTAGGLKITTISEAVAQAWYDYKQANGAAFTVYCNDAIYEGGYDPDAPRIKAVSATYTINGISGTQVIPNAGESVYSSEFGSVTSFVLDSFTATTTGDVTELFMDYDVFLESDGSQQHTWKQINATDNGDGTWTATSGTDLVKGLQSNTAYVFELSFNTNPGDYSDRAHYPTDGSHIRIHFKTGDLTTGINGQQSTVNDASSPAYDLQGRRVGAAYKGIVIQRGRKLIKP